MMPATIYVCLPTEAAKVNEDMSNVRLTGLDAYVLNADSSVFKLLDPWYLYIYSWQWSHSFFCVYQQILIYFYLNVFSEFLCLSGFAIFFYMNNSQPNVGVFCGSSFHKDFCQIFVDFC